MLLTLGMEFISLERQGFFPIISLVQNIKNPVSLVK